ncbi:MAG TPA: acyl-CoA dehydrogenase family protein [Candidatus Dormibacteraeota bacterium]|nr:acyl-CoA dehydrogenase family protein [Candidatus Dormibacteraeota bacterium]
MDFGPGDLASSLKEEVAALCRRFEPAYWLEHDRSAEYPWEFVRAFAERGWLGLVIPTEHGGAGLGVTEAGVMLEAICESGAGLSGASPVHFYLFPLTPVIRHGSEAMKAAVLPGLASGELMAAFGVTEPTAGSDTSRITTRAERRKGRWLVNGQKVWTTNAQNAQKILLLARDRPRDPAHPYRGMTLFFTDLDRAHVSIRRIEKLGREAVDSNEVFISDLEVPDADVVGEVGEGFRHLLDGLNPERIVVALEAIGIGRAALRIAAAYARERVVFDRPIGSNQAVAHPLAAAWARLEAAELLAFKAAWLFDRDEPCAAEANAAKLLAADAGFDAVDASLQALGGFGYAREYHLERLWREVRLYKIAPISQQMVLNHLAQHVLGLPKSY